MYYPVPEISFKDGLWLTLTFAFETDNGSAMYTAPQESGLVYPNFDSEYLMNV